MLGAARRARHGGGEVCGMRFWNRSRVGSVAALLLAATLLVGPSPAIYAVNAVDDGGLRVIFFASDGMRPDLLNRYAQQGRLPTFADLSEHGSTNNTFHRSGEPNFNNSTSFAA